MDNIVDGLTLVDSKPVLHAIAKSSVCNSGILNKVTNNLFTEPAIIAVLQSQWEILERSSQHA